MLSRLRAGGAHLQGESLLRSQPPARLVIHPHTVVGISVQLSDYI